MRGQRYALICALIGASGMAWADGWARQDRAGIVAALAGHTFEYDSGAVQTFYASGQTYYEHAEPSWGRWEAREDAYCSQWPPASGWACYGLETRGDQVRFVGESGAVTTGWIAQE